MPIKALGKGSVASALSVLVTIINMLSWAVLIIALLVFGVTLAIDLAGGELQSQFFQGRVNVTFEYYVIGIMSVFVLAGGIILVTARLKKVLATLEDGDPFVSENAPRLLQMSIIIALMEIGRLVLGWAARMMEIGAHRSDIAEQGTNSGLFLEIGAAGSSPVNLAAWLAAITLWVLSQVFAEGARLREEEKMTI
jgi:hypothetical protein